MVQDRQRTGMISKQRNVGWKRPWYEAMFRDLKEGLEGFLFVAILVFMVVIFAGFFLLRCLDINTSSSGTALGSESKLAST